MNKALGLLAFAILLGFSSCDKEKITPSDTGHINLSFNATFGGETLIMNSQPYDYAGKLIRFSKISFYLANLRLLNQDQEIGVSDIAFIDITETHHSETSAKKGVVLELSNIPIGDYTHLKFGIGVPSDMNETNPIDYPTNHPLGNDFDYYEAWDSYIFAKVEGQYDGNGDGLFDENDILFAYHAGMNRVYREIEVKNSTTLKKDEVIDINFELDVRQLFNLPSETLLNLEPHAPNEHLPENIIMMNNFKSALKLK